MHRCGGGGRHKRSFISIHLGTKGFPVPTACQEDCEQFVPARAFIQKVTLNLTYSRWRSSQQRVQFTAAWMGSPACFRWDRLGLFSYTLLDLL